MKCNKCGVVDTPIPGSWWQIQVYARPIVVGAEQPYFMKSEQVLCSACSLYRLEQTKNEFNSMKTCENCCQQHESVCLVRVKEGYIEYLYMCETCIKLINEHAEKNPVSIGVTKVESK